MEHYGEEEMDVVDGFCANDEHCQQNLEEEIPNGRNGTVTVRTNPGHIIDSVEIEDTTDILVSTLSETHGQSKSSPSSTTEFNDSKKVWWDKFKKRFTSRADDEGPFASCDPHDFEYNMNHKNRGKVLIFNHCEFDPSQGLESRPGTNKDVTDLTNTFERLGFKIQIYSDLKFEKMHAILDSEALANHKDSDCFAVVVLTHGRQNLLHAYDVAYKPECIWKVFTADKCPSLAGKPKMFFIQACRGEKYDEGTLLISKNSRTVVDGPGDRKTYKIPNQADFLMVFSTAPASCDMTFSDNRTFVERIFQYISISKNAGHFSWRNSMKGGCFVQAMCKIFDEYAFHMDILSLITVVNKEVAINYQSNVPRDITQHQKKQIPHVSHTLTRQIRFSSKRPNSTLV